MEIRQAALSTYIAIYLILTYVKIYRKCRQATRPDCRIYLSDNYFLNILFIVATYFHNINSICEVITQNNCTIYILN